MGMSPQQREKWAVTRANGRKAFVTRFTFLSTLVYAGAMVVIRLGFSDRALSFGLAVGIAFYALVMSFIAKAVWHQSEAEFLKQTNTGA
jgi:hypothetical protein